MIDFMREGERGRGREGGWEGEGGREGGRENLLLKSTMHYCHMLFWYS